MQTAVPFACFLSLIRPPGVQFENSLLQILPVDKSKCPFVRDHTDISFQLFTRHNPTVYEELRIGDDERLFASSIDLNDQTVIYFHAFMEQPDDGSGIIIREAYMQRGDANVIMIDAHQLEAGPWYFTAAQNTWYIGNFAAQFIDYLVSRGLDLKKTHLVGHSLGAQSAGVAGAALKTGRVSRITGLDPALPLFDGLHPEQRLDSTDADFVDVIHTDAGIFGVKQPLGHVDFYPNGGQSPQPGCELKAIIPEQLLLNTCDGHHPAIRGYYTFFLQHHIGIDTFEKHKTLTQLTPATKHNQNVKDTNKADNDRTEFTQDFDETGMIRKYIRDTLNVYENIEINDDIKSPSEIVKHTKVFTENIGAPIISVSRITTNVNKQDYQESNENFDRRIFTPTQKHTYTNIEAANEISDKFRVNTEMAPQNELSKPLTILKNYIGPYNSLALQELTADIVKKDPQEIDDVNENNEIIPEIKLNVHFEISPYDMGTVNPQQTVIKNYKDKEDTDPNEAYSKFKSHVVKRDRRSLSLFNSDDNLLFRLLNFLTRNRKNILPVLTVMREINTLVKSGNGELSHFIKERNNYIGAVPSLTPVTYSLESGSESTLKGFVRKLLGLGSNGDKLTITGSRR